jgi:hypothetical protein
LRRFGSAGRERLHFRIQIRSSLETVKAQAMERFAAHFGG